MTDFTLLPNLQTAITGMSTVPTEEGELRRKIELDIGIEANGERVSDSPAYRTRASILGAGDIIAIDPKMIARVEPVSGAKGVEPNYFPYVEFTDGDFPWRYTLDGSPGKNGKDRTLPWLALLALSADEFRYLERGNAPLTKIEVFNPFYSLPDASQLWATAHVQVTHNEQKTLSETIEEDAAAYFSRLMCPRKLSDNTAYFLFLVPVYEVGRLTGLGKSHDSLAKWNDLSWDHTSQDGIELPIYQQWRFSTSSMEDFESLVRRLTPNKLTDDSDVGATRTAYIGDPGYYNDSDYDASRSSDATVEIEGALQKPGFTRDENIIESQYLTSPMTDTLNQVLENSGEAGLSEDGPENEDPLVALPVYGRHYTHVKEVKASSRNEAWFHEANLDLRMRTGSGVGSRIVQRHQEDFMHQSWAQVGDIQGANALRGRLQTAEKVGKVLLDKHVSTLSTESAISVFQPLLDLVPVNLSDRFSATEEIRKSGVPDGTFGRASRRIAAKRTHRNAVKIKSTLPGIPGGLDKVVRQVPEFTIPGNVLSDDGKTSASSGSTGIRGAGGFRGVLSSANTKALSPAASSNLRRTRSSSALTAHSQISSLSFIPSDSIESFASAAVTKPQLSVEAVPFELAVENATALAEAIPSKIADDLIVGTAIQDSQNLEPIIEGPRIVDPLAGFITEEDPNYLLPNAESLTDDSVTLTEENKTFIESLMLGANHEMNRELRWREFPTDMRATVFSRFWDTPAPADDEASDDIRDIHLWNKKLGKHFKNGIENRLVLIIRGEVIRRYPDIVVVANKQTISSNSDWHSENGTSWYPEFSGLIDNQTAYYGFDLTADEVNDAINEFFFVIMEPPGRLRFGLDIGSASVRQDRLDLSKAPVPFNTLSRDPGSWPARSIANTRKWQKAPAPVNSDSPDTWDDFSWNHVYRFDSEYIDFDENVALTTDDKGEWGRTKNSASIAKACFQKPVQAVVRARRILDL